MPTQKITTAAAWTLANAFVGGPTPTDILVQNTSADLVHFALTDDAGAPTVLPLQSHMLLPNGQLGMQLRAGERVWFATREPGSVVVSY